MVILLQVIDILIRVVRSLIMHHMHVEGPRRVEFLDTKFVSAMNRMYPKCFKSRDKEAYLFPNGLRDMFPTADATEVQPTRYYFPCNVGNRHWVGICFDSGDGVLTVMDCNIALFKDSFVEKNIKSIVHMLPYLARFACQPVGDEPIIQCFDVVRSKSVAQINNPADSGLMALLLMGRHAVYGIDACKNISHEVLAEEGRHAAILTYEFKEEL